jgi:hypothetical protein
MNVKLGLGLAGDGRLGRLVLRESGLRFYANWLRNPRCGVVLIEGLTKYSYERLDRWFGGHRNGTSRARVVYGAGDEFYPTSDGFEAGLARLFERSDVLRLADENSHEWLMIRPQRVADEVEVFLAAAP